MPAKNGSDGERYYRRDFLTGGAAGFLGLTLPAFLRQQALAAPPLSPRAGETDRAADAKLQQLADESRKRADGIQVSVTVGNRTMKATLHRNPLMKYTDVPRLIDMATLWVWQVEGRPVALGKVEAYRREGCRRWLYCCASTSTGLVEARWPDGRRFRARKAGIEWTALNGPVPQETAKGRLRQLKVLFRRFSATARELTTSEDLRALARPLHEYPPPKQGVLQGILCGFAANGTNPDVIVALETVNPADGKNAAKSWRYGVLGMTAAGVSVKLDKKEVFTKPYQPRPGDYDTFTYFWDRAPKK
jgi:hypothetical protein